MEVLGYLLVLAYAVWALYSGYRIMSGRSEWLDRKSPLNMVVKFVLSYFVGGLVGGFYLVYLIFRLMSCM